MAPIVAVRVPYSMPEVPSVGELPIWPPCDSLLVLNLKNGLHAPLLGLSPWFHSLASLNGELVGSYANAFNPLLGDFLVAVTAS